MGIETKANPVVNDKTASFVDKSGWDRGPWDSEPDRVEFRMPDLPAFACLMVRNQLGSWCGYVGVPPGHPAHGVPVREIDGTVEVHGGITYAAPSQVEGAHGPDAIICHVPAPGESDDVWWLGFDTGHAFDISPGLVADLRKIMPPELQRLPGGSLGFSVRGLMPEDRYRDAAYVRAEVESLARQLAAMGNQG